MARTCQVAFQRLLSCSPGFDLFPREYATQWKTSGSPSSPLPHPRLLLLIASPWSVLLVLRFSVPGAQTLGETVMLWSQARGRPVTNDWYFHPRVYAPSALTLIHRYRLARPRLPAGGGARGAVTGRSVGRDVQRGLHPPQGVSIRRSSLRENPRRGKRRAPRAAS